MYGKIKKVVFIGMFGILYISFLAQVIYVLGWGGTLEQRMMGMAALSLEWLVLIAARYVSKRSSGNSQQHNGGFRRR